jgi:hypothetical protein
MAILDFDSGEPFVAAVDQVNKNRVLVPRYY